MPVQLDAPSQAGERQLRTREPEKHQVHGISIGQTPPKPRRKRPAGQRRLEPETDALSRQLVKPSQHHPTCGNSNRLLRERRQASCDGVGIDVLANTQRVTQQKRRRISQAPSWPARSWINCGAV